MAIECLVAPTGGSRTSGPVARSWTKRFSGSSDTDQARFFLWVHLFEPHSPYGNPQDPEQAKRPASARYDDEIAEADRQVGRLLEGLGEARATTTIVVAGDHGEAFGEHGEITHSIFTYDTTLRVPLIMSGAGITRQGAVVKDLVSLVDVAPTMLKTAGIGSFDADGIDLAPAIEGGAVPDRALYAESFAPLLDFGWSPLRTIRRDGWKYIAAPEPELYHLSDDPAETENRIASEPQRAADLARRVDAISSPSCRPPLRPSTAKRSRRLQALGYVSGRTTTGARADPERSPRRSRTSGGDHVRRAARRPARAGSSRGTQRRSRTTRRQTCALATC